MVISAPCSTESASEAGLSSSSMPFGKAGYGRNQRRRPTHGRGAEPSRSGLWTRPRSGPVAARAGCRGGGLGGRPSRPTAGMDRHRRWQRATVDNRAVQIGESRHQTCTLRRSCRSARVPRRRRVVICSGGSSDAAGGVAAAASLPVE
jgi:hypothetical protein